MSCQVDRMCLANHCLIRLSDHPGLSLLLSVNRIETFLILLPTPHCQSFVPREVPQLRLLDLDGLGMHDKDKKREHTHLIPCQIKCQQGCWDIRLSQTAQAKTFICPQNLFVWASGNGRCSTRVGTENNGFSSRPQNNTTSVYLHIYLPSHETKCTQYTLPRPVHPQWYCNTKTCATHALACVVPPA